MPGPPSTARSSSTGLHQALWDVLALAPVTPSQPPSSPSVSQPLPDTLLAVGPACRGPSCPIWWWLGLVVQGTGGLTYLQGAVCPLWAWILPCRVEVTPVSLLPRA